jgi:beta-glucanase (GH16 family)
MFHPALSLLLTLLIGMACQSKHPLKPVQVPVSYPAPPPIEYTFSASPAWQDEFEYSGKPDSTKWSYDLGGNGWGNNELQNYTNNLENAYVENGHLIIKAIRQSSSDRNYSSARLVTKGKGDFLYGKIEIRAKLPTGRGTWPALWTLASQNVYGSQYWPDNGELDIMEHVGFDQNTVHANIHTKAFNHSIGTNKGNSTLVPTASTEFHLYTCEWKPNLIIFSIDGTEYFRFQKEAGYSWAQWPFDKPQHLLMNIAVGGNWGGQKGVDDSIFPQSMAVDYVRVYKLVEKK